MMNGVRLLFGISIGWLAQGTRFFGLANIGTAGAAAGLLGPLADWSNARAPGAGYTALFVVAGLACAASALPLRGVSAPSPLPPEGSPGRVSPALDSERSSDANPA